jgi:hypothetical protein
MIGTGFINWKNYSRITFRLARHLTVLHGF